MNTYGAKVRFERIRAQERNARQAVETGNVQAAQWAMDHLANEVASLRALLGI